MLNSFRAHCSEVTHVSTYHIVLTVVTLCQYSNILYLPIMQIVSLGSKKWVLVRGGNVRRKRTWHSDFLQDGRKRFSLRGSWLLFLI